MSILKRIEYDDRVFETDLSKDKKFFTIVDTHYDFWAILSKSELLQLIEELKVIAGEMSE